MKDNKNYDLKCDIFVSASCGDVEAKEIAESLARKNYDVYFSGESDCAGRVNGVTLSAISKCKDFVVVLSNKCLEALKSSKDPISQELRRAMQRMRNVVPVVVDSTGAGFNQLRAQSGLSEEIYDFAEIPPVAATALASRLTSRARWSRTLTILSTIVAIVAVAIGAMLMKDSLSGFPRNAAEREAASRLISVVESSVSAYASATHLEDSAVSVLSNDEVADLMQILDGSGVDLVALAGLLAAPASAQTLQSASARQAVANNAVKVLSAIHSEEAKECVRRVNKVLGGAQ